MFPGFFIPEVVDEKGNKWSGDTRTVDTQTLFEVFLNMPLRTAMFH